QLTPISSQVLYYIKLLDFLVMFILIFKNKIKNTFSTSKILFIIYATILLSGLIHGEPKLTFDELLISLLMCMISDYWLRVRPDQYISMMKFVLTVMVVINFICIIVFPEGMYTTSHYSNNWFLGHKNSHLAYMMAGIAFRNYSSFRDKNKLRITDIVFMLIACLSSYLVDSMSSFLLLLLYTILIIRYFFKRRVRLLDKMNSRINFTSLFVFAIVLNILCIFVGTAFLEDNQILLMLGRDSNFTGRIKIWSAAVEVISRSPLIGYGVINSDVWIQSTGIFNGTHAHNYFLNIFVMGGLICFIEHLVLYYKTRCLMKENIQTYSIGVLIGLYFIIGLTNINFFSGLFNCLFIFAEYCSLASSQSNKRTVVK
ncbi:MAG: O-antigen ligase family protein, partial [Oscillospiraceae bacterium]|nr:O-antigen ligase family protein [Oscillospiraceae bacterium]